MSGYFGNLKLRAGGVYVDLSRYVFRVFNCIAGFVVYCKRLIQAQPDLMALSGDCSIVRRPAAEEMITMLTRF